MPDPSISICNKDFNVGGRDSASLSLNLKRIM